MNKLAIFLVFLLYSSARANNNFEWYGVNNNDVLEITCDGVVYKLIIKKKDIVKKEQYILNWANDILNKNCKEKK